jgi:hypothetical protein
MSARFAPGRRGLEERAERALAVRQKGDLDGLGDLRLLGGPVVCAGLRPPPFVLVVATATGDAQASVALPPPATYIYRHTTLLSVH